MRKQEICNHVWELFNTVKDKHQEEKGMTKEETKKLFDKIYYLAQQMNK